MKLFGILAIMFALLLASLPVAFSLGSLGLGLLVAGGFSPLMAPQAILSTLDGFILLAVPLFLLMTFLHQMISNGLLLKRLIELR